MKTPVIEYGAQARLQHSPPHFGIPPSGSGVPFAPAPQTWPAPRQPVVPGACGSVQVPTLAPVCLVQIPVQHSASDAQMSLVCVQ
jgi:hypothetical protein